MNSSRKTPSSYRPAPIAAAAATVLSALALAAGCAPAAQQPVSYALYAAGTGGVFTVGSWQITLDVAQLGLGPIYFCTTAGASAELCPTSLNEFADVAVVDLRDPTPQLLGEIRGVTGNIGSASYDLAYSWFPRQNAPAPAAVAPMEHSIYFAGQAAGPNGSFRFVAEVDIVPKNAGLRAIRQIRGVTARIDESTTRLDIRVDPQVWWRSVDFNALAQVSTGAEPVPIGRNSNVSVHDTLVAQITTLSGQPTFLWSPNGP